jgi:putative flippase GtrA
MVTGRGGNIVPDGQHPLRHGLAFAISGATAFAVDAAVLRLLTALFDVSPIIARLPGICLAVVAGWLMHRTFTFVVTAPPSLAEFVRYAGVAWTAAAINYAIFVLIILLQPRIEPLLALFISSLIAMVFAYLGMRYGAFRQHSRDRSR